MIFYLDINEHEWDNQTCQLHASGMSTSHINMGAPASAAVIRGWDRLCSILDNNGHGHWDVFSCCFCFVQVFCDDTKDHETMSLHRNIYTWLHRKIMENWLKQKQVEHQPLRFFAQPGPTWTGSSASSRLDEATRLGGVPNFATMASPGENLGHVGCTEMS